MWQNTDPRCFWQHSIPDVSPTRLQLQWRLWPARQRTRALWCHWSRTWDLCEKEAQICLETCYCYYWCHLASLSFLLHLLFSSFFIYPSHLKSLRKRCRSWELPSFSLRWSARPTRLLQAVFSSVHFSWMSSTASGWDWIRRSAVSPSEFTCHREKMIFSRCSRQGINKENLN